MDSLISPQGIENIILTGTAVFLIYGLGRLVRALETISVVARLSLNPSTAHTTLAVSKKEIEAMINPTEAGRYAKFNIPNSLKAWKDEPLA